jgi:uncharacterized membrane protein (DUF485 family)
MRWTGRSRRGEARPARGAKVSRSKGRRETPVSSPDTETGARSARSQHEYHETVDAEPEPHDWELIAGTEDYKTLLRERGRFTAMLAAVGLGWFFLFILLAAFAEGLMAEQIADGLTVAFILGVSQILVLWGIIWMYNSRSNNRFMALQERAARAEAARRTEADRVSGASARTGDRNAGTEEDR